MYTPTCEEVREAISEWVWSRRMFRPELESGDGAEFDRWLAAHDAEKRAEWEAEHGERTLAEIRAVIGGYVVPCARCGQRKVIASDALNSDIEACGRCGVEIGLHELAEQGTEEPEGEHVFIERYGMYHAKFGGIGGDVTSLGLTREAWKALGEADVLAVSVLPVEQEKP